MKKQAILVTLAAVLLFVTGTSVAQGPHGDMPMFEGHVEFMIHSLDLSPQQQATVKSIIEQAHQKFGPSMHEAHDLHVQIQAAALSDNFDATNLRLLIEAHKAALEDLIVGMAQTESDIYRVLTPEQRTKLQQMIAQHHQQMEHHEHQ